MLRQAAKLDVVSGNLTQETQFSRPTTFLMYATAWNEVAIQIVVLHFFERHNTIREQNNCGAEREEQGWPRSASVTNKGLSFGSRVVLPSFSHWCAKEKMAADTAFLHLRPRALKIRVPLPALRFPLPDLASQHYLALFNNYIALCSSFCAEADRRFAPYTKRTLFSPNTPKVRRPWLATCRQVVVCVRWDFPRRSRANCTSGGRRDVWRASTGVL